MKRPLFYCILLLSVYLNSCVTYIEKDLDIKSKLVLFGYLVPQLDTTIISLSNSVSMFATYDKLPKPIANATIEISENNIDWIKLTFNEPWQHYFITQTDFPIIEGKTYYIRASAPEYETVFSSCKVPFFRETNLNLRIEEAKNDIHNGDVYSGLHYHCYYEWDDYPREDNYYIFCRNYSNWYYYYDWENNNHIPYDSILYHYCSNVWDEKNYPCIFSDKGQDGKKMSILLSLFYYNYDNNSDEYNVTLLQTDENCYLFEKSYYEFWDMSDFQSFMLEPMQLYTNIKNGYGVFGAFVMRDYSFEFEEPTKLISFSRETTSIP